MRITTTAQARDYFDARLGGLTRERFHAVHMDQAGFVLGETVIDGDKTSVAVPFRRLIANALAVDARAMLVAHNHPGGSLEPSPSDLTVTRTLAHVAELVGIRLYDHIIWTRDGCTSMREREMF